MTLKMVMIGADVMLLSTQQFDRALKSGGSHPPLTQHKRVSLLVYLFDAEHIQTAATPYNDTRSYIAVSSPPQPSS